jgi:DNA-binding Lrp family transcriptional regulator
MTMMDERMTIATGDRSSSDWWEVDREILECLAHNGAMSVVEVARQLRLSEGEATSLLSMLAREGKVRICQVMLAA